ncbi:monovalent cation/H+ antiporter subunit D [Thalassospira sp. GB04J01]|uniref:monovalent cation/H+ antiporter subunit D n=1 Tax=Thalassospira sp. GB04J01 TaxID=1485225 RepID=UPI000C9A9D0F|nr:monovalent cation/H+ antiporter subunit D [Thalassospira sp. GB04J01]|tara:strand:+ start:12120 stop:13652 length:1533 start_codon:yes stop_codon:yes gene_type:complete
MGDWIVIPIVLPAVMAALIVLAVRHDILLQRVFSITATMALVAVTLSLLIFANGNGPEMYALSDWPAPFGIVLVLDRLSAMMIFLTSLLGLGVVLFASSEWDQRGKHFHALFQFQLMGVNGAFLTGDLFNLFVFFEVLLIASYGLMLHGAGADRLKAGMQYVVVNLTGSALFLVGVGMIYSVTGTLNMADLAIQVANIAPGDAALLRAGALVLLLVFCVKAAMVPIHFWLPGTYANAPAPVAALFAIMTKVGAYSVLRVYSLAFGDTAGDMAWLAQPYILPAALITIAVGMIGVLAAKRLNNLIAFAVIGSMGTLLTAIGLFTPESISAGLYYLLHSTFSAAALFLIADLVVSRRGQFGDSLNTAPVFHQSGFLAVLFFIGAIGMAGMPPLSGFIGKLQILDASRDSDAMVWIWSVILVTSLMCIIGFGRAGSVLFWKSSSLEGEIVVEGAKWPVLPIIAACGMLGGLVALTVFAGPISSYLNGTADQIFDTSQYIRAVLGDGALAQFGQ